MKNEKLIINNIDDIKNNKELILSSSLFPRELMKNIFKIVGTEEAIAVNGER